MKFLHVILSVFMVLTSAYGVVSGLDELDAGQAGTVQQDSSSAHDCCDEPEAPAEQDCCDSPACGQCTGHHVPALVLALAERPAACGGPVPAMTDTRLIGRITTPPFRPPIV
jgi:hypothetical protein